MLPTPPAFPLDATIRSVMVNGRPATFKTERLGDVMRAVVSIAGAGEVTDVVYAYDEGTDVYVQAQAPQAGARNQGLRILRSWADASGLHLRLEGLGGQSYPLGVRSPKRLGEASGVRISQSGDRDKEMVVSFDGPAGTYVRRDLTLPIIGTR